MRVRGKGRGTRRQVGWYCDHRHENPWTPYDPEGWRKNTHLYKTWKRGKQILQGASKGMQTQQAFSYDPDKKPAPRQCRCT